MGNMLVTNRASIAEGSCYTPVNEFKFLVPFDDNTTNGLYFNNVYLPEEILQNILSYVPPKDVLNLALVCRKWCNIIKSENFWMHIYDRYYRSKAKKLPWYVYYCFFTTNNFHNLLKNGSGQEQYRHWKIVRNDGDLFKIENPPTGCEPLPTNVPDFNGHTSCFVTSYDLCVKVQEISLRKKRLLRYILNKFMPHIYVSEWVAGRYDCGCMYKLGIRGYGENYTADMGINHIADSPSVLSIMPIFYLTKKNVIQQWEGKQWEKIEILVEEYPRNVMSLIFEHEGRDTQFWKGHYGSKMAGGMVKILFDSIQPLGETGETKTRQSYQNTDM